jgi:hypothetical protein
MTTIFYARNRPHVGPPEETPEYGTIRSSRIEGTKESRLRYHSESVTCDGGDESHVSSNRSNRVRMVFVVPAVPCLP